MEPGGEAMEEGKGSAGLSWRSRGTTSDHSSWWTSAVDLSSTLISKMDQVPASLVGFTLPWHAGARAEAKQAQPSQRGAEFAGFWAESFVGANKPVELPKPRNEIAKPLEVEDSGGREQAEPRVVDSPKRATDEEIPSVSSADIAARSLSGPRVGESRRRTKRMPVDLAPAGPKQDSEAPIRSKRLSTVSQEFLLGQGHGANPARVHSVESRQSAKGTNVDAATRRVDEGSVLSSQRSSGRHSSRSSYQGILLEETIKNNPPYVLPQPPGSDGIIHLNRVGGAILKDEIFPGNTNRLAQLRVGNPKSKTSENHPPSRLSKDPVLGGSYRVTRSCDALALDVRKAPSASLPTSPRLSSKESRASKLLRRFKLSGIGSWVGNEIVTIDTKSGKRSSSLGGVAKLSKERGSKVVNNLIVSQHQKFAKSLEPRKPGITNGVRQVGHAPTIHSECIAGGDNGAHPSVRNQEGTAAALQEHATKKSSSRWLFKWKWASKPAAKVTITTVQRGEAPQDAKAVNSTPPCAVSDKPRDLSPTAEIMSDARDAFYTKSDRYSSGGVGERVANSDKKSMGHRKGSSWGCASLASTAAITPVRKTQRSRIHQDDNDAGTMVETRVGSMDRDVSQRFRIGEAYQDCQESFRSHGSFRSAGGQSFRKGESVFEDCHGSFRSIASGGSCASFRSVDSPTLRKRTPSTEEIEWDNRLPPPLQADHTLTIGDVAALCNSSLKFVFKCREIQHFNKFLRSQKTRLVSAGSEKGNTDCFNVILSGTDIEVSSMVAAMSYAWFLESTVPKVTGETWHAVPMIDIPRHQMHKHKDAAWLFDACGIDPAALLYADEIELASLVAAGRIKISIIGQDVLVTRNEVGSVCTLLGEKLVAEAQCLLEPRYMKTLLLAGILLDTENLDFASMRDTEMTTSLLVGSGSLGRNGFFDQLREVEDDDRVSKFITRNYGDGKQLSGRKVCSAALKSKIQHEADQEQSDKDSLFTQSQDHTSTSEAGTNSSLDEDSPRLKQRSSFKYTKLAPHSAPVRSHQLPSPSSAGCNEDEKAVALIRKAATQFANSGLQAGGTRSPSFTRIRKKIFLYQA